VSLDEGSPAADGITLAISDPSQFSALRDWMRGQPGVRVAMIPATPGPGELGTLDLVSVLVGSGGVVAALKTAIKTLPDFIKARRTGLRIETTVKGQPFVLDATNVDEVMPILERLLGD